MGSEGRTSRLNEPCCCGDIEQIARPQTHSKCLQTEAENCGPPLNCRVFMHPNVSGVNLQHDLKHVEAVED